jgi:hypothetical protein
VIESVEKLEVGAGESAMAVCRPEGQLTADISSLWSAHKEAKASVRKTRGELKALRSQLGRKLHEMKSLMARSGRGGGWSAFLRGCGVPRASADRYVRAHEASLVPPTNRPTEAFSEPTEEEIRGLVRKLLPRLRRYLVSPRAVDHFYNQISSQVPLDGFGLPQVGVCNIPKVTTPAP